MDDITGMGDDDSIQDIYPGLDPNNKNDIVNFILKEMKIINLLSEESKNILKNTLIYFCYFKYADFDWKEDFYSILPPFSPPENALDFYKWYYEAFFGEINLEYIIDSDFIKEEDTSIFDRKNKRWYL